MQKLFTIILVSLVFSACSSQKSATSSTVSNEELNKMLEGQSFTFVVERVNVPIGRPRFATETYYNLTVNNHKVSADLPYFGNGTQATMAGGGIVFSSEQFKYEKTRGNRGWNINIKPEGILDVNVFNLFVMDDASASLIVSSNKRGTISYDGFVSAVTTTK